MTQFKSDPRSQYQFDPSKPVGPNALTADVRNNFMALAEVIGPLMGLIERTDQDSLIVGRWNLIDHDYGNNVVVAHGARVAGWGNVVLSSSQSRVGWGYDTGVGDYVPRGADTCVVLGFYCGVEEGANNVVFGYYSNTWGTVTNAICGGYGASVTSSDSSIALGLYARVGTNSYESVAIGRGASISDSSGRGAAFGYYASVEGFGSYSLGYAAFVQGNNSMALGNSAYMNDNDAVMLGGSAQTVHLSSTPVIASDARDKLDIRDETLGLDFINRLRPRQFRLNPREAYVETECYEEEQFSREEEYLDPKTKQKKKGIRSFKVPKTRRTERPFDGSKARNRIHHGLIAQELKETLDWLNIDHAAFVDRAMKHENLAIRYDELISSLIKAVQELSAKIR